MSTVAEWLRRAHLPYRERSRHAFHHPGRIDSRRKKVSKWIYTAKHTNPQGYRDFFSRQICNMDVRILLTSKLENPPTIKASKAWSTGKPVAHFPRTHVASISKNVSEVSTGKPVAVTLITELQVYLTQPSRKKTRIAIESQGNR